MTPVFLHGWDNAENMLRDFDVKPAALDGLQVIFASYGGFPYDADAFVLLRKGDGTLYEVNGSHCSCYGLEGQWELEPTSLASIQHRLDEGWWGRNCYHEFADELRVVLNELKPEMLN